MYILTNMSPNLIHGSNYHISEGPFPAPLPPSTVVVLILDCIEVESEQVNPSPLKGILVYELADAGRRDAEGLDVDGALLVDGQHVLQRVHLLAHRRARVAPVPPGVPAAAT